ncbi:molybdate ABC transporter permease subunit [Helicobacter cappadocius]|uniref:Molybdenum transport system permease n=1 Tax=Helicobacter cappadocius TaxID=3063998 RepID=A0AA90PK50_9HELI|nr:MULTISPECIES: molybdate ABC transporter permease subunit [unclassified Helicobacter]MDO7253016.1 molybdate ABC transporter permease subunit [Helicobacter sp. faydin-H75]MDP2538995.1 molybdate ABC transporter permease subunit [Helicobacter sp. faydin-H76]
MFDVEFWQTIRLSLMLAFFTTLILLPIGIFVGNYLAFGRGILKIVLETLTWMPLVLPPTVLGFYLLLAFSPNHFFGAFLQDRFGIKLVFSFYGLIIGSVIFSLPFMINPIKNALSSLPLSLKEASYTLGKGRFYTLFFVLLPNIKSSILMAMVTTFAHTIGEFGVVMMIGGDIPGVTRVVSIAIYTQSEATNYAIANQYALCLCIISFVLLFLVLFINARSNNKGII